MNIEFPIPIGPFSLPGPPSVKTACSQSNWPVPDW